MFPPHNILDFAPDAVVLTDAQSNGLAQFTADGANVDWVGLDTNGFVVGFTWTTADGDRAAALMFPNGNLFLPATGETFEYAPDGE
jgi:hypothetical protein